MFGFKKKRIIRALRRLEVDAMTQKDLASNVIHQEFFYGKQIAYQSAIEVVQRG